MKKLIGSAVTGFILLLAACSEPSSTHEATLDEDARIRAFFERTYQEDLADSPERQSYRGIKTDYDKWQAYGQAKTANALFANALSRRLAETGGMALSVHPGGIFTPLHRHLPKEEMIALIHKT